MLHPAEPLAMDVVSIYQTDDRAGANRRRMEILWVNACCQRLESLGATKGRLRILGAERSWQVDDHPNNTRTSAARSRQHTLVRQTAGIGPAEHIGQNRLAGGVSLPLSSSDRPGESGGTSPASRCTSSRDN